MGKGSSLGIPLNIDLVGYSSSHEGTVDASALTHGVRLAAGALSSKKRILKTGSGDDILVISSYPLGGAAGSVVNGGNGGQYLSFWEYFK